MSNDSVEGAVLYRYGGHHIVFPLHTPENNGSNLETSATANETSGLNNDLPLPSVMVFNSDSLLSVLAYSVMFVIAAVGNLAVFIALFRNRRGRSRVSVFVMHLAVADLIVAFIMLPLEISWHITVAWLAGDAACRILMFFRAFGFYLSSFILIAISLDRYFAVAYPLSINDGGKRGKLMLILCWLFSITASIPQSVIFHVEQHPKYPWFTQCVTFNFFPTPAHQLAYHLFNVMTVYLVPLIAIVVCYTLILWHISKRARQGRADSTTSSNNGRTRPGIRQRSTCALRSSGIGKIGRARTRTLKMTIVIVLVFVICWTPYFVMSAWWWIDEKSAKRIDPKIQRGLFIFAVSNSCMNPIVYGMFSAIFRRELKKLYTRLLECTSRHRPMYATTVRVHYHAQGNAYWTRRRVM